MNIMIIRHTKSAYNTFGKMHGVSINLTKKKLKKTKIASVLNVNTLVNQTQIKEFILQKPSADSPVPHFPVICRDGEQCDISGYKIQVDQWNEHI